MLRKVTVFLKRPLPCKVKDIQWLLVFVAHCHPLIVNSVSPFALLNNCLSTGHRPPRPHSSRGCSGGTTVLLGHEWGRAQWGHRGGCAGRFLFVLCFLVCLPGGGGRRCRGQWCLGKRKLQW